LTSGKLNEVIDPFVGEIDATPCRRNQWLIKAKAPLGANWFGLLDSVFNASQDQMTGGASLPGSSLVKAPVEFRR